MYVRHLCNPLPLSERTYPRNHTVKNSEAWYTRHEKNNLQLIALNEITESFRIIVE